MSMAEIAKANGISVVFSSILPVSAYHTAPNGIPQTQQRPMTRIRALNDLDEDVRSRREARLSRLLLGDGRCPGAARKELSADDLHPNAAGYA